MIGAEAEKSSPARRHPARPEVASRRHGRALGDRAEGRAGDLRQRAGLESPRDVGVPRGPSWRASPNRCTFLYIIDLLFNVNML